MKTLLLRTIWPIIAGLIGSFVIMMICEFINSFFFPLPDTLDWRDTEALKAFTISLPWTVYILVVTGWTFGSFKAGCITTYLSNEQTYRRSLVVGALLVALSLLNGYAIGQSLLFTYVTAPLFIIFTYIGHRYMKSVMNLRVGEGS